MTTLTWNHARTIGVRAMDDQHGILMDTLNELRLALVRGLARETFHETLGRFLLFSRQHFESEERLLQRFGYPGIERHREHHARLLEKVRASARRIQASEAPSLQPLLQLLLGWYQEHIETADRGYGPWLNQRGIY